MATLRELKGRIGSVASTEKITGAMKMISSAKMHKAEGELRKLVPFRRQIDTIIANLLSSDAEFTSPLTEVTPVEKVAIVAFGSDDGLCGAFNANLAKDVRSHIQELREQYGLGLKIEIYPIGKRMEKAMLKLADANTTVRSGLGVNSKSDGQAVTDFGKALVEEFTQHNVQRVDLDYMNFISLSRQRPKAEQILPISTEMFASDKPKATVRPYIFEPNPEAIFRAVLPMFLLSTLQEVFCENRASEQAARVMAMQSANDNAKKLLEQLQLEYNKLRQQGITNELLDIVGGQVRD
ncbi:MAG: ATP synthase F1 subunit gamma [Bacteroidales bacterium]|nr:ATP synthase F1 subunit gamma [Bacteroidales bacterium]